MKKLLLSIAVAICLSSCAQHMCPTYNDSGAKWKKHGGHPYGGSSHKHH